MGTFGTDVNPAHFVEIPDPDQPGQVKRPDAGSFLKAQVAGTAVALPDITIGLYGYWAASPAGVDEILVSADGGSTWVGPLFSAEITAAGSDAVAASLAAEAAAESAAGSAADSAQAAQTAAGTSARPITQNPDGTWPPRNGTGAARTTQIFWKGTLPGPTIGAGASQAVAGLDVLIVTTAIPS